MATIEFGSGAMTRTWTPNRQGYPCLLGTRPANTAADLSGADFAVLGVPFISSLVGQDNDIAPRNVRIAALKYGGTNLPELGFDPMTRLSGADYGDVDLILGDMDGSMAAVEAMVGQLVDAGCLPVTIGGNAPCASYSVIKAIGQRHEGPIGLVNLDGHSDARAGDPGPNSSNWVRAMYDDKLGVRAESHIQVGIRGMNNPPTSFNFYSEQGIRVVTGLEARRLDSEELARQSVAHASAGTTGIWFAIDFDALDPGAIPGWDELDPLGLSAADVLLTAYEAGRSGKLIGISLMMINGQQTRTHLLAVWTILYALAGVASARTA